MFRGEQDKKEALIQNLQDAGCDQKIINEFFKLLEKKKIDQIMVLLKKYRNSILNVIHENQKKIDILDYLIFDLKKNNDKEVQ